MFRKILFVALFATTQSPVFAQDSFSFEAVNGFLIVRMLQRDKNVYVEYLSPGGDGALQCLALDAENKPMAIAEPYITQGNFIFYDLDIDLISQVICRERPY